nr:hypothetical protein [uncultured Acidocella sp.]
MIDDEFSGQGGTYLLDPATGKRTLLKRTAPAGTVAQASAPPVQQQQPEPSPQPANLAAPAAEPKES